VWDSYHGLLKRMVAQLRAEHQKALAANAIHFREQVDESLRAAQRPCTQGDPYNFFLIPRTTLSRLF